MQTCVGLGPARCHILTLHKLNILLDCGLWDACGLVTPAGTPACLTPILKLLSLYELHGALIATPHGALTLPMLLAAHPGLLRGRAYATLGALDAAHHLAADLAHSMAPPPPQQQPCAPPADNGATQAHRGYSQPPALTEGHPVPMDAAHQAVGAPGMITAGAHPLDGLAGGLPPVLGLHPLPGQQAQVVAHGCWQQALPAEGWRAGLRRVRAVRYGEDVSLDITGITARPYPSGSGFGHAVWVLHDGCRSIAYMPEFALPPPTPLPPGLPPPLFMELQLPPLNALTALITAPHTCASHAQPFPSPHPHQAMHGVVGAVVAAARARAPSLIPLPSTGAAWQLVEEVGAGLAASGLVGVPLFLAGPASADSLALANTSMEFVGSVRKARAYSAEPAFGFDAMIASGRLIAVPDLSLPGEAAQGTDHAAPLPPGPCVVITPPSTLAAGGLAHRLVRHWGGNPHALLIITAHAAGPSPGAGALVARAVRSAHPGLQMQVMDSALGAPPPASHLASLLAALPRPPAHVMCWHQEAPALQAAVTAARAVQGQGARGGQGTEVVGYQWLDVVSVKLPKWVHTVPTAPAALQGVVWQPVGTEPSGLMAGQLTAVLQFQEGTWRMDPLPNLGPSAVSTAASALAAAAAHTATQPPSQPQPATDWEGVQGGPLSPALPDAATQQQQQQQQVVVLGRTPPDVNVTMAALRSHGLEQIQVTHPDAGTWAVAVGEVEGRILCQGVRTTVSAPSATARRLLAACLSQPTAQA